jgi:hypothetical protein
LQQKFECNKKGCLNTDIGLKRKKRIIKKHIRKHIEMFIKKGHTLGELQRSEIAEEEEFRRVGASVKPSCPRVATEIATS